jgi:hypothetical protein
VRHASGCVVRALFAACTFNNNVVFGLQKHTMGFTAWGATGLLSHQVMYQL